MGGCWLQISLWSQEVRGYILIASVNWRKHPGLGSNTRKVTCLFYNRQAWRLIPLLGCALSLQGLPILETFGDLEKSPALAISGDWQVRVGVAGPGPDGGAWMNAYCLLEFTGGKESIVEHEWLGDRRRVTNIPWEDLVGPVQLVVSDPDARLLPVLETRSMVEYSEIELRDRYFLFIKSFPVAWEGRYHIEFKALSGCVLSERILEVVKPAAHGWTRMALPPWRGKDGQAFVRPTAHAAYPVLKGDDPAFHSYGKGRGWRFSPRGSFEGREFEAHRLGKREPLPGRLPGSEGWTPLEPPQPLLTGTDARHFELELRREGNLVVVSSEPCGIEMVDWPEEHLLVRWWVNGKLFEPPLSDSGGLLESSRQVTMTRRIEIRMDKVPEYLGELCDHDKVAMQVMYAPECRVLPKSRGMLAPLLANYADEFPLPLLSNVLEIRVEE